MRCHACDADATTQWQRPASEEETTAHLDALRSALARANDERRLQLRLQVAELSERRDNLPAALSEADRRAITARIGQQTAALQAEHDAIPDAIDLDHHLPVTVAVFGCDDHQEVSA